MKILNPGKFEITIGGETKTILVSLGLKTELYKLITRAQIEIAGLQERVLMDEVLAKLIQEKDAELKSLQAEEAEEFKINNVEEELDSLYARALSDIEVRQSAALNDILIKKIDLSESVFADAISCLLSERNEIGVVTNKLDPNVIMWSTKYAEAQEELTELLHAVTEYITSALKKISGISLMVKETTEAASQSQKA